MKNPEITVQKERNGWKAYSAIALPGIIENVTGDDTPGKTILEIETGKPPFNGKGIQTRARVVHKTDYGFRCSISYSGTYAETGGDYSRGVRSDPTARVTEKKARTYQEESLAFLDQIIEDVALHYGKTVDQLFEPALEAA